MLCSIYTGTERIVQERDTVRADNVPALERSLRGYGTAPVVVAVRWGTAEDGTPRADVVAALRGGVFFADPATQWGS